MPRQTKYHFLSRKEIQLRLENGDRDPELIQEVLNRYMRGAE